MTSENASPGWAAYDLPLQTSQRSSGPAEEPASTEADPTLVLRNVAWFVSLRWLVIGAMLGLAATAWLAGPALAAQGLGLRCDWPLGVAAVLIVVNLVCMALSRAASGQPQLAALAWQTLWLQIVLDLAVLTVVVHYLGSVETFAPFMYLFHIVLACIFFPNRQSLLVSVLAMVMYLLCVGLESSGVLASRTVWAEMAAARGTLPSLVLASSVLSVVFVSATVWYLASRLEAALRQRELELAAANRRLIAATEERAAYMLQTTHQLKAPCAAIHANAQLLLGGYCGTIPPPAIAIIEKIATRCDMLSQEIKEMLQLANLRSGAQELPVPVSIEISELIRACEARFESQLAHRRIRLSQDLTAATVQAIPDHAIMILDNVLANAIHYSRDGQEVSISCRPTAAGGAVVVVRDRGIGIPAAKLPHVFDDYYRTTEAVAHNKTSTGLGLAIVRQAAVAGKIGVHVESAPAQGTVISIHFPAAAGHARGPMNEPHEVGGKLPKT